MEEGYRIFVGVDWADEAHQVWVSTAAGEFVEERTIAHTGAALAAMAHAKGGAKAPPRHVTLAAV